MNIYAVALKAERRECGAYSRPVQEVLRAFQVHAANDQDAYTQALAWAEANYAGWYYSLAVELITAYHVSTEGAAWAYERVAA